MNKLLNFFGNLGFALRSKLYRLGAGTRLFFLTLIYSADSFRRIHLTIREIYYTGVLSLVIIVVSAFFVGMVLGLQGYYTLEKYGSSEAIGVLVALALVRELGPVVTALLFAGRAVKELHRPQLHSRTTTFTHTFSPLPNCTSNLQKSPHLQINQPI